MSLVLVGCFEFDSYVYFLCFRIKILFLSKFSPNILNGLLKLKCRLETNSNGELDGDVYFFCFALEKTSSSSMWNQEYWRAGRISHGVMSSWFLLNFFFISALSDILASPNQKKLFSLNIQFLMCNIYSLTGVNSLIM